MQRGFREGRCGGLGYIKSVYSGVLVREKGGVGTLYGIDAHLIRPKLPLSLIQSL
nr:hypothetical protein [Pedobacter sp. ASV19]